MVAKIHHQFGFSTMTEASPWSSARLCRAILSLKKYDLHRVTCEFEFADFPEVRGSGTIYPALKRLKAMGIITEISGTGAKKSARSVYRATPIGRQMLRLEIMRLQNQVELAKDRLKS